MHVYECVCGYEIYGTGPYARIRVRLCMRMRLFQSHRVAMTDDKRTRNFLHVTY